MRHHLTEHVVMALAVGLLAMALALVLTMPVFGEAQTDSGSTQATGEYNIRVHAVQSGGGDQGGARIQARVFADTSTTPTAPIDDGATSLSSPSTQHPVAVTIRSGDQTWSFPGSQDGSPMREFHDRANTRMRQAQERVEAQAQQSRERVEAQMRDAHQRIEAQTRAAGERAREPVTQSQQEARIRQEIATQTAREDAQREQREAMVQAESQFLSERLNELEKLIDRQTQRVQELTETDTPAARVEREMLKSQIQALEGQKRALQAMPSGPGMGGMGGYPGGYGAGYGGAHGGAGFGYGMGMPAQQEGDGPQPPPGFEGVPGFAAPGVPILRAETRQILAPERLKDVLRSLWGDEAPEDLNLLFNNSDWARQIAPRLREIMDRDDTEESAEHRERLRFDVETDLLEARSNALGETIRQTDSSPERERKREELRDLLQRIFERRQEQREREARAIAEELERIRTLIERRQQNREVIIDRRMRELTGDRDLLVW